MVDQTIVDSVQNYLQHLIDQGLAVSFAVVFGSHATGDSHRWSDIDLLVHFRGTDEQREQLDVWLSGWSSCLAEVNYMRTGYKSDGLLDVHIVSDADVESKTGYAAKIDAPTDAALPLKMGGARK